MEQGTSETKLREQIALLNEDKKRSGVSKNGSPWTMEYSLESLMCDLLDLREDEKRYNQAVKNGFGGILVVDKYFTASVIKLPKEYTSLSDTEILSIKRIKNLMKDVSAIDKVSIYRDKSDFDIGTEIDLKDIRYHSRAISHTHTLSER